MGERGFQRTAIEDNELHQLVQGLSDKVWAGDITYIATGVNGLLAPTTK
jgi:hypothetical protein